MDLKVVSQGQGASDLWSFSVNQSHHSLPMMSTQVANSCLTTVRMPPWLVIMAGKQLCEKGGEI